MSGITYNRVSSVDEVRTVYWFRANWTGDKRWHYIQSEDALGELAAPCGVHIEHRPRSTEWSSDPGGYICRKCWAARRGKQ